MTWEECRSKGTRKGRNEEREACGGSKIQKFRIWTPHVYHPSPFFHSPLSFALPSPLLPVFHPPIPWREERGRMMWGIGRDPWERGMGGKCSATEYSPLHSSHLLMKSVNTKGAGRRKEGQMEGPKKRRKCPKIGNSEF